MFINGVNVTDDKRDKILIIIFSIYFVKRLVELALHL